jgi:hypothetical protein
MHFWKRRCIEVFPYNKQTRKGTFISEVSPFFRVNGYPPETKEYEDLVENNFANYNLSLWTCRQSFENE